MTLLRALALAVPLLALTGCFDFLEEIWINADGSGRVRIDVGITTALFALGGSRMKEELESEFKAEAERARQTAADDEDVKKITLETREEGGLLHVVYDIEVRDVTRLPEIQRKLLESSDRLRASQREASMNLDFRIEETDEGYRFVQAFGKGAEGSAERLAEQMAAVMFADKGLTVRLHGPQFAAHNGKLSEDGKTVEWHLPFSKLLASGGSVPEELRAEVVTGKMMIFYVAGAAVALLMVLGGVSMRRRG